MWETEDSRSVFLSSYLPYDFTDGLSVPYAKICCVLLYWNYLSRSYKHATVRTRCTVFTEQQNRKWWQRDLMLTVRLRLGAVTLNWKEDEVFHKQVSESHARGSALWNNKQTLALGKKGLFPKPYLSGNNKWHFLRVCLCWADGGFLQSWITVSSSQEILQLN
jgi:hypothetical protein